MFCSPAVKSFLVMYCDRVLKILPDVKTLISLHQQLLSVGVASGCGPNTDKLNHSEQLRNAGMFSHLKYSADSAILTASMPEF